MSCLSTICADHVLHLVAIYGHKIILEFLSFSQLLVFNNRNSKIGTQLILFEGLDTFIYMWNFCSTKLYFAKSFCINNIIMMNLVFF